MLASSQSFGSSCRSARKSSARATGRSVHWRPWRKSRPRRRALSDERLRDFLRDMLLIRRFEEKVEERFRAGELPGFLHVAIGQEAVAVGVCAALEEDDVIASTHRAHGHTLARGTSPERADGRAVRKARGLLARLRRVDAPLRRRARQPRRERRRRRWAARHHRRRARVQVPEGAARRARLLRRRRDEHRDVPRVAEPGAALERAGGLRPREQLVGRVDAELAALADHGLHAARGRVRDALDQGRRPGDRAGLRRRGRGDRPRSPRATGRCCWSSTRTASSATTSAIRRSTARRASSRSSRETQDPITKLRERLGVSDEEWEQLDAEVTREVEESVEFAKNGTDPKPEDALKNVYA